MTHAEHLPCVVTSGRGAPLYLKPQMFNRKHAGLHRACLSVCLFVCRGLQEEICSLLQLQREAMQLAVLPPGAGTHGLLLSDTIQCVTWLFVASFKLSSPRGMMVSSTAPPAEQIAIRLQLLGHGWWVGGGTWWSWLSFPILMIVWFDSMVLNWSICWVWKFLCSLQQKAVTWMRNLPPPELQFYVFHSLETLPLILV